MLGLVLCSMKYGIKHIEIVCASRTARLTQPRQSEFSRYFEFQLYNQELATGPKKTKKNIFLLSNPLPLKDTFSTQFTLVGNKPLIFF